MNSTSAFLHHRKRIFAFAVLMVIFFIRFSGSNIGLPSFSWDYGAHIVLVNEILSGRWFPTINGTVSEHLISKYLPLYHGLWGSYLPVIFLKLFGVSTPKAMLFVSDMVLLSLGFVAYKMSALKNNLQKLTILFCFFLLTLPQIFKIVNQGMFSQLVGLGFMSLSFYFYQQKKIRIAIGLILYSFFSYPDFALWLLPFFYVDRLRNKGNPKNRAIGLALCLFHLLIVRVFFARILLPGFSDPYLDGFFLLVIFYLFNISFFKSSIKKIILYYLLVSTLFCSISYFAFGYIEYYPKKLLFAAPLLLLYFLTSTEIIKYRFQNYFLMFCFLYSFVSSYVENRTLYSNYILGTSSFSSGEEAEVQQLRDKYPCKNKLFIPDQNHFVYSALFPVQLFAYNSQFGIMDFPNESINSPLFRNNSVKFSALFKGIDKDARFLQEVIDTRFKNSKSDSCLFLAKSYMNEKDKYALDFAGTEITSEQHWTVLSAPAN